ncbi:MAG TPA: hypothetical protein ENL21_05480, partial [Caldithrix abyssi]|nr:hypothetical protein [Caldithrix abyssi]
MAQGALSLIDGESGALNFQDGRWLDFEAKDLDVVLKIPLNLLFKKLQLSFLQDTESWIFFPKKVSLFSGGEQQGWKLLATEIIPMANGPDLSRKLVSFDLP